MAIHTRRAPTRILALVICSAVVFGGSIPELGNIWAFCNNFPEEAIHYFNKFFLLVGILGLIISSITLFCRFRRFNNLYSLDKH